MPVIGTKGAASAQGFGFTTPSGAQGVAPFISRLTTSVLGANLFDDGAVLVTGSNPPFSNVGILAPITHTNSGTKTTNLFNGTNLLNNVAKVSSSVGVVGYIDGFSTVSKTNTIGLAKNSINTAYWGGETGTVTAVDSAGNIYLVSALYPESGGGQPVPCLRKYNSSGVLQWNRSYSSDSSFAGGSGATPSGMAVNSSYVYLTVRDSNFQRPAIVSINSSDGSVVSARYFSESLYSTDITTPALDSSGNVYFAVSDYVNGGTNLYKYAPALASVVAVRNISGYGSVRDTSCVSIDSLTGDVYWLLSVTWNNDNITKTSSALSSPSTIAVTDDTTSYSYGGDLQIVSNAMCFTNSRAKLIYVLPLNGTKTGTYSVGGASVVYSTRTAPSLTTPAVSGTSLSYYTQTQTITTANVTYSTGTTFSVSSVDL